MADFCNIGDRTAAYTDEEAEQHARERGVKPRPAETEHELDSRGVFVRQANYFTARCGDGEGEWPAEAGRYEIYWGLGCHWSNRPIIARNLLGLQNVIRDRKVSSTGTSWVYGNGFGKEKDHRDPDTGAYFLSEFYKNADPDFEGRATTPALVDLKTKKTVNSDYHRLSNYIEVGFRKFQPEDAPDLYPKKYRREIDQFNDWLFPHVNNAHYRMAFCSTPFAYDTAFDDFFESLDRLEKRLSVNRFVFGDFITDADIRLYPTLLRWQTSYWRNIGPVKHRIEDYPNLWGYLRELYSIPAFRETAPAEALARAGARKNEATRNLGADYYYRIGAKRDWNAYYAPESREKLSSHPDQIFLHHPEKETPEDYQSLISESPWNRKAQEDREPDNPANSPLDQDPSINPLKGKIDA